MPKAIGSINRSIRSFESAVPICTRGRNPLLKEGPTRRSKFVTLHLVIGAAGWSAIRFPVASREVAEDFESQCHETYQSWTDHPGRAGTGAAPPPSGGEYPIQPGNLFNHSGSLLNVWKYWRI